MTETRISATMRCLRELREGGFLCDVQLVSLNANLVAHRVILAAGSRYFKSVFEQDQCCGCVTLPFIDGSVMRILLDYLYGVGLRVFPENVHSILEAAKMLLISDAVLECEMFIKGLQPAHPTPQSTATPQVSPHVTVNPIQSEPYFQSLLSAQYPMGGENTSMTGVRGQVITPAPYPMTMPNAMQRPYPNNANYAEPRQNNFEYMQKINEVQSTAEQSSVENEVSDLWDGLDSSQSSENFVGRHTYCKPEKISPKKEVDKAENLNSPTKQNDVAKNIFKYTYTKRKMAQTDNPCQVPESDNSVVAVKSDVVEGLQTRFLKGKKTYTMAKINLPPKRSKPNSEEPQETDDKSLVKKTKTAVNLKFRGQKKKLLKDCKCPICSVKFQNRMELNLHKLGWHRKREMQRKSYYFYKARKNGLNSHLSSVIKLPRGKRKDKLYVCSCRKVFKSERALRWHSKICLTGFISLHAASQMQLRSSKGRYRCVFCDAIFQNKRLLIHHRVTQHREGGQFVESDPLKYKDVDKKTNPVLRRNRKHAIRESQRQRLKRLQKPGPFPCRFCQQEFNTIGRYHYHIRSIHEKKFKCTLCPMAYGNDVQLLGHMKSAHAIVDETKIKRCPEPDCSFLCYTKTEYERHLERHLKKTEQMCTICNRKFKYLDKHMEVVHSNKEPKYLCCQCGKSFLSRPGLLVHQKKCENGESHSCPQCNFTTNDKNSLEGHMFSKHGIKLDKFAKTFVCDVCGYQSIKQSTVRRHRKLHDLEETQPMHKCEICSKSFATANYLKTHFDRNHSAKLRPLKCSQCEFTTKSPKNLKLHTNLQHVFKGLKPYKCGYCSHASALRSNCMKHVTRCHPGKDMNIEKVLDITM